MRNNPNLAPQFEFEENTIRQAQTQCNEAILRIGEEFEEDTTDGRHCKTIVTLDGNVMTTKQNGTKPGDKNVVVVREL